MVSDDAGSKKEFPSNKPVEGEEGVFQKPVFEAEAKPLRYTRPAGNYSSDSRPERIGNTSVDKTAVHVWRTGSQHGDMLERSSCRPAGGIPSCHAPWTK